MQVVSEWLWRQTRAVAGPVQTDKGNCPVCGCAPPAAPGAGWGRRRCPGVTGAPGELLARSAEDGAVGGLQWVVLPLVGLLVQK